MEKNPITPSLYWMENTTEPVSRVRFHAVVAAPPTKPPPWMWTMTGRSGASTARVAAEGVNAFRNRQSSGSVSALSATGSSCGQAKRPAFGSAVQLNEHPPKDPQTPHPHSSGLWLCAPHHVPHGLFGRGPDPWRQCAPAAVAVRTPLQVGWAVGAAKRSAPLGGAAKGTPR